MTPRALFSHLRATGVVLEDTGADRLRVDAPKGALTPALRSALVTHKAALLWIVRRVGTGIPLTSPQILKRHARQTAAVPPKQKKVWRRSPYWQACTDATRLPSGALDLEACDLLFAALALREGHTPEETRAMLHRVTPRASTRRDYCTSVVSQVSGNPASHVTAELAERYAAAHPFVWELGLSLSDHSHEPKGIE